VKSVGISLSGGGSRGVAHVGILKALEEAGIKISKVTGTSAGAIVGAFYCSGFSPDCIMDIIREINLIGMMRPALKRAGLLKLENTIPTFKKYIKNDSFSELKIPLVVSATNLGSGLSDYLSTGPLIMSVLASCAVPFLFQPININDNMYIDGGILNNLPIEPLEGQCDLIIGSSCNPVAGNFVPTGLKSLAERVLLLGAGVSTRQKIERCDLFLEPDELKCIGGFNFSKADDIFQIGYSYGRAMMPEIKQKLSEKAAILNKVE
jgi:NTE family protein